MPSGGRPPRARGEVSGSQSRPGAGRPGRWSSNRGGDRVTQHIAYPSKGHLRSPEVTNRHLPITFDQKEVETWHWCQYVRLRQANRLICNMTHFGHHVTLAGLDLRSNFDLDLSRSSYIWFDAPQRSKHDGVKIVALTLKSSKKRFVKFWNFDPWGPQF